MPNGETQHAWGDAWRRGKRSLRFAGVSALALMGSSSFAKSMEVLPSVASGDQMDAIKVVLLAAVGGTVAFAVTAAVSMIRSKRQNSVILQNYKDVQSGLKARVDRLEALLNTADHRLVVWEPSGDAPMIVGALSDECGVPRAGEQLLAFGTWLDAKSAAALDQSLEVLRDSGEAFGLTLVTRAGTFIEANGRTAGGCVVLRLRDLTGVQQLGAEHAQQAKALQAQLDTLHALFGALPTPVWRRSEDGVLQWVNAAYVEAVDGDVDESSRVIELGTEFLDAGGRAAVSKMRDEEGRFQARMPVVAAGRRRIFDVTDVKTESGVAGMAIDVSDLERLQQDFRRTVEFHARTLDQLATAVAIFGPDRRLQFFNAAFRSLWGLEQSFLEAGPEDSALLDALRAARKLPEQADYRAWRDKMLSSYQSLDAKEFWWHLPDGRTLRVIANPHPQGGVTYIYENVTERLDLESRYNALIRVQGETLDHLSEAVAVFGSDGRLRLWNSAFGTLWRLEEDRLGESPHINAVVNWETLETDEHRTWRELAATVTGLAFDRTPVQGRLERNAADVIDYATVPLPDGGTLVTFVNVTDSVNVERALLEKNEALEQADQLKNAFIQHVSYELRSPLTNIIGFAQLLSNPKFGQLSPKQGEYTDYILSSSSALLAIINDILDLATIDAGIMELDLSDVDVAQAVVAAMEGLKDRLNESKINLRSRVPQDIGFIRADERRLRQVLFNMISNAVRFSDEGGDVDVECERKGEWVEFRVRDHGCGIPQDMLDQVFARFVGRDAGQRRRGAGLGLSIVKSFVELHGGRVDIESQEGVGTTVICQFPLEPEVLRRGDD